MRIAIITGEYPPLEGGVGDFTRELGQELCEQGHDVHVLTTSVEQPPDPGQDAPIHVDRTIETWRLGAYMPITRWLHARAPDVVNVQYQAAAFQMRAALNLYPRLYSDRVDAPIVVTYHDLLPPYLFPKAGPLRQWAVWQLAQHADGVIVTNSGDYTRLTEALGGRLPPLRLIPIGSNIAPDPPPDYDPATWRAAWGFKPDDVLVGFFGFLNRSKGIGTLLAAIARLAQEDVPAHLLFIGGRTGSSDVTNALYADQIDAEIARLGIADRVHRTGFAAPETVSAALLACDICALPYRDGASLRRGTLHAALAHGCPIVTTTPRTETPELRDGENVVLIPPSDADALADKIRALWEAPRRRHRLGKAAALLARTFSWDRIAAHTAQFFQDRVRAYTQAHPYGTA